MKFLRPLLSLLFITLCLLLQLGQAHARILFTNELFENEADTATIDADGNATADIILRFGATADETLRWIISSARFLLSNSLTVNGLLDINGNTFTLDTDNVGTGANVSIVANQGSEADGILRYNTTTNQWEIANDGVTFTAIPTASIANAFIQNGNSFGGTATLGTNDNNILAFEVNNAERMRINTAGDVGIGATTIPANKKLTVSNTAAPTFNAGGNGMGVNMTGGGGIYMKNATDNVEAKFESYGSAVQVGVSGGVQAPVLLAYRNDQPGARLDTTGHFSVGYTDPTLPGTGGPNRLTVRDSGAGALDVGRLENNIAAAVNSGASLLFAANRTTGGMTNIASVGAVITDIANTAYKGMLVFRTADNAAPAERMRIDHLGRVGVNTTSLTDRFTVTETAATSVSAIQAIYTQLSNANTLAGEALHVVATASGDAADTLRGIFIDSITGTASTEQALNIGTGWDRDLVFQNSTPSLQAPNNFELSLNNATGTVGEITDVNTGFGAYAEMGAFMNYMSYVAAEFSRDDPDRTADGNQVWGDSNQLGVDEQTNCVWSVLDDTVGGIGRSQVNAANSSCIAYHSTATGDAQLLFNAANTPVILMKVKPSNVSTANDRLWVGLSTQAAAITADPATGIFFTNNNTTWVGRTTSGGTATANCGVAVNTAQFALLKIEVRSTTDVRFYVDPNTSDGISWTSCGAVTTNIPAGNLTSMIANYSTTTGRTLDIDFFRSWQQ